LVCGDEAKQLGNGLLVVVAQSRDQSNSLRARGREQLGLDRPDASTDL
jgi:hypothetical protein